MESLNEFQFKVDAFFCCCYEAGMIPLLALASFPTGLAEIAEFGLTGASFTQLQDEYKHANLAYTCHVKTPHVQLDHGPTPWTSGPSFLLPKRQHNVGSAIHDARVLHILLVCHLTL
jgi:hypothetical protein